jgi:hypothetical protein
VRIKRRDRIVNAVACNDLSFSIVVLLNGNRIVTLSQSGGIKCKSFKDLLGKVPNRMIQREDTIRKMRGSCLRERERERGELCLLWREGGICVVVSWPYLVEKILERVASV